MYDDLLEQQKEAFAKIQQEYDAVSKNLRTSLDEATKKYLEEAKKFKYFDDALLVVKTPQQRAAFSDRTAWVMACMSQLAYEPFEREDDDQASLGLFISKLDSGGFKLVDTFNLSGTQAFLAHNNRYAVLAFRGTSDWTDVQTDIRARRVSARCLRVRARAPGRLRCEPLPRHRRRGRRRSPFRNRRRDPRRRPHRRRDPRRHLNRHPNRPRLPRLRRRRRQDRPVVCSRPRSPCPLRPRRRSRRRRPGRTRRRHRHLTRRHRTTRRTPTPPILTVPIRTTPTPTGRDPRNRLRARPPRSPAGATATRITSTAARPGRTRASRRRRGRSEPAGPARKGRMMAQELPIQGAGTTAKARSPVAVAILSVVTLGV